MKFSLLFFTILVCLKAVIAQDYITNEIIQKVLLIKYNKGTATGFFVKYKNHTYLITAKHVVDSINKTRKLNGDTINIKAFQNSQWIPISGRVYFNNNKKVDIAVINTPSIKLDTINFDLTVKGMILGENGYFLGFPFGGTTMIDSANFNSPLPLVKGALLSSFYHEKEAFILLLDAHNNPGFSGGPIVFRNHNTETPYKWNVIGVVSGYRKQENESSKMKYYENSGIMIGYGIYHAIEIVDRIQDSP